MSRGLSWLLSLAGLEGRDWEIHKAEPISLACCAPKESC